MQCLAQSTPMIVVGLSFLRGRALKGWVEDQVAAIRLRLRPRNV